MSPFDKARYARLLQGLDATEISLRALLQWNEVFRIDAEYFGITALDVVSRLRSRGAVPLASIATITDGIHTSLPFVEDGDVKVLSAKHPKENYIDCSRFETISAKFHAKNPRTALRENDVLISTVGTIGNSAVVTADLLPANSDRHIGIIRLHEGTISPYLLSTFLLGHYGKTQSIRETTGNVQPNLFISKIGQLLVPPFTDAFEKIITAHIKRAYQLREESRKNTVDAEAALLEALGLDDWKPAEPLCYIRNSREAFTAGRLDAEYFSPKSQAVRALLKAQGDVSLGEVCTVGTGIAWRSNTFIERGNSDGVPFVRIRDCKPGGLKADDLDKLPYSDVLKADVSGANIGDIVLGMDGLKWFYSALLLDRCQINQRVAWLHSFEPTYSSAFLMVVINSIIGQSQLLSQMTIAQTVGHITLEDIRQLRVPILDYATRSSIACYVEKSITARQNATKLLESAKRAVEIAIEDGELEAIRFLEA